MFGLSTSQVYGNGKVGVEENPYKMVAAKGLLKELPLKVQNVYKNTLEHLDPQFTNYQFKLIIKQLMCGI